MLDNSTKKSFANALIQLSKTKSIKKITISQISDYCNLNRQSFYYHFADKFELLTYIYVDVANQVFDENLTYDNWNEHLANLLRVIKSNHLFYQNCLACDQFHFEHFIHKYSQYYIVLLIQRIDNNHHLSQSQINFYCSFYSYGISGIIIDWILKGCREEPEVVANLLKKLESDTEKHLKEDKHETTN